MFRLIILAVLAIILGFYFTPAHAADCTRDIHVEREDVTYNVDTSMPKHLKGATITVTLANGQSSSVPAEKFMVVPRIQKTVVGQNKNSYFTAICDVTKKNTVYADARKDYQNSEVTTVGTTTTVESKKGLVPSINYYRHEVLDSPLGLGVGVDSNGTVKGAVGIDF